MEPTITITTERNPQKRPGTPSASASEVREDEDVRPALRHTDEYAAAFDLEVWKAQQQARFRAQLRQAKERLEKKIRAELTSQHAKKLETLEETRRQLEEMALQLEAAGEALQKRQSQLEARESAFEARRIRVAEQHEAHLARVEQRAKRAVEEAAVAQDSLKAQVREKDLALEHLQERLRSAESEYDALQRRTARFLTERDEVGDRAALREAEGRRGEAEKTIRLLRDQLREQINRVDRLARERDTLAQQHHDTRMQLHDVTRERNRLAQLCEAREAELLRQMRKETKTGPDSTRRPSSSHQGPQRKADPLLHMMDELKRDIFNHVASGQGVQGAANGSATTPPPGLVCEVGPPPLATSTRTTMTWDKGCTSEEPHLVVEEVGGRRAPYAHPHVEANVATHASSARVSGTEDTVDVNRSADSAGSYRHVEVRSWHSSQETASEAEAEPTKEAEALVGSIGAYNSQHPQSLPPLAPTNPRGADDAATGVATPSPIAPSPHDFARAATVSSDDAAITRAEMEGFVRQMKINREKLLDTGVYSPNHSVVKEMTEKISLYEKYLTRF